jgi:hypothetical protein
MLCHYNMGSGNVIHVTVELSRRSVARDLPDFAKSVTCVTVGFSDLLASHLIAWIYSISHVIV